MFIRDEETGAVLVGDAAARPATACRYIVRHGQGYTVVRARSATASPRRCVLFVPPTDPVKVFHLTLRNNSTRRATLLGHAVRRVGARRKPLALAAARRHQPRPRDRRRCSRATPSARSSRERVAFLDLHPGDRADGHRRPHRVPRAQRHARAGRRRCGARSLSDRTGAGLDPCGAVQVRSTLEPSETRTLVGLLGDAGDADEARALVAALSRSRQRSTTALRQARGVLGRPARARSSSRRPTARWT